MPEGELDRKIARLREILCEMGSAAIGFSGGVDSTFLLKVASEALGDGVVAITAFGAIHPAFELESARRTAADLGVRLLEIRNDINLDPEFAENPPDRCYLCKKALFTSVIDAARKQGVDHVADGSNLDDLKDYRPGARALSELGVQSPLIEAGFTKADVRQLSRTLGLSAWDRPAMACLASRFPYGTRITPERLAMVDRAEKALRDEGFSQVRVRYHGHTARIEVPPQEIPRFSDESLRNRVFEAIKQAGFTYVALDLKGYRTGSMNESLKNTS